MSFIQFQAFRLFTATSLWRQIAVIENCRTFSSTSGNTSEAEELAAAREWYQTFSKSTIPAKAAETSYSRSSGPGGQKTNKTSSKATVTWPLHTLLQYIPKVLHQGIRDSRYYVSSSDAINIQCDTGRSQSGNKEECHDRLYDEIKQIYKKLIPGITTPEQKKRIEALKKSDNAARLKMKKIHSDKKRARSGGG